MAKDSGDDVLIFQDGVLIDIVSSAPAHAGPKGEGRYRTARVNAQEKYSIDPGIMADLLYGRIPGISLPGFAGKIDCTFRHAFVTHCEKSGKPFPVPSPPVICHKEKRIPVRPSRDELPELPECLRALKRKPPKKRKRG